MNDTTRPTLFSNTFYWKRMSFNWHYLLGNDWSRDELSTSAAGGWTAVFSRDEQEFYMV